MTNLEIIKRLKTAKDLYDKELNCNTCDIDGDAFAVHGNSVKGRHTGSINV